MDPRASSNNRSLLEGWLAVFLAALLFYGLTSSRYPQWQDAGWQQLRILRGQLEHPLGLALVHPLHHFLGRAAVFCLQFLEPAFAITLVSVLAAAATIANIACTIVAMTRRWSPALLGAASLLVAHTFWQHATHTESYALTAALLSTEWLCLAMFSLSNRAVFLYAMMLFNGLGISNHLLSGIATPVDWFVVIVACTGGGIRGAQVFFAFLAWFAGALPYGAMVVTTIAASGDLPGTLRSALVGQFAPAVFNTVIPSRMLTQAGGYVLYNLPNLTIPLVGLAILRRRRLREFNRVSTWPHLLINVLIVEFLLFALFAARYVVADQYGFFFPIYMIAALLCGLGAATLSEKTRKTVMTAGIILVVLTPAAYPLAAKALRHRGAFPAVEGKPYRDGYRSLLVPWGAGDDHARRLNEAALKLAGPDGLIVIVDPMIGFSLEYLKALQRIPPGVQLRSIATLSPDRAAPIRKSMHEAIQSGKRVVLVPAHRDSAETYFKDAAWERQGDLYLLLRINPQ